MRLRTLCPKSVTEQTMTVKNDFLTTYLHVYSRVSEIFQCEKTLMYSNIVQLVVSLGTTAAGSNSATILISAWATPESNGLERYERAGISIDFCGSVQANTCGDCIIIAGFIVVVI